MPEQVLVDLARRAKTAFYSPNTVIVKEGEEGNAMFLILHGEVHTHVDDFILDRLGTLEIFGQIGLYDGVKHIYSATTDTPIELLRFEQQDFHELVENNPTLSSILGRNLLNLLNDTLKDLFNLRLRMEKDILPLGIAMSQEGNIDHLLERMLFEAKKICNSDAGTLYLRTDDDRLAFKIMYTDSLGIKRGGISGEPIDFEPLPLFDFATREPNMRNVASYVASTGIHNPDPGCI